MPQHIYFLTYHTNDGQNAGRLYATRVRLDVVFDLSAESGEGADVLRSVGAGERPPAHLLQALRALPAIRRRQLAGRAGVVGEQAEERREGPVAAAQAEEQVAQLHADARRAVGALVTQREEHIWLAAVSIATQRHAVTLCTINGVYFSWCGAFYWAVKEKKGPKMRISTYREQLRCQRGMP